MAIAFTMLFRAGQVPKVREPTAIEETIIQERPVRIATSSDSKIFPTHWRTSPIQAKAEALENVEIERTRRLLNEAVKKYPQHLLSRNLKTVFVLSQLNYRGISAGGTNSREDIYLRNRGLSEGFTDTWIEGAFHHELSSILLRNYPQNFDMAAWTSVNPEGFSYGADGVQAVKQGRQSKRLNPSLYAQGFICDYSTASIEEDFNIIAEHLFIGDAPFWAAVDKYPKIRAKQDLVLAFYRRLDAKFDRTFFISIANDRKAKTM